MNNLTFGGTSPEQHWRAFFPAETRKSDESNRNVHPETTFNEIPNWKRFFDLFCILLTIPIWLPLMLLIIFWIKLVSPGPVIYCQERIGFRGRPFMIMKFRSMHVNAVTVGHEDYVAHLMRSDQPMEKLDGAGDSRLIKGARTLRALGLDEFPQLLNVARGEMSLVGPRPCTSREFLSYKEEDKGRVQALPGLTGYWQVNGKNLTTFREMIAMDQHYLENISIQLDLKIMWKTPKALFKQAFGRHPRLQKVGPTPAAVSEWTA